MIELLVGLLVAILVGYLLIRRSMRRISAASITGYRSPSEEARRMQEKQARLAALRREVPKTPPEPPSSAS